MPKLTIVDAPEYQILPPLAATEYEALKASIAEVGVLVPVELDEQGHILDGHHRVRISKELGISDYPTIIRPGLTEDEKRRHIVKLNLVRRNPTPEELMEFLLGYRKQGWSLQRISDETGLPKSTIFNILKKAPDQGDLPETFIGTTGKPYPARPARPSVYAKTQAEAKKAIELLSAVPAEDLGGRPMDVRGLAKSARKANSKKREDALLASCPPQDYDGTSALDTVQCCDIRDLDLPPDSVDLFFCDPPYSEEALPLYDALGELAARALKRGGFLIAYVGNWHLPQVIETLGRHLQYHWVYVEYQPASEQRNWQHRNFGKQRLMLVFRRPGEAVWQRWVRDALQTPREKDHHEWQQSETAARHYIPAYAPPNGIVVDPFTGGGTTAAVCKALGRHFLVYDKDPVAVATTLARLATVEVENSGDDGDDDPDGGDSPEGDGGTSGGDGGDPPSPAASHRAGSAEGTQSDRPSVLPVGAVPTGPRYTGHTQATDRTSSVGSPDEGVPSPVTRTRTIAAGLPPAQLAACWDGDESHVVVTRPDVDPITIAVERVKLADSTFNKPNGNEKTARCYGVIGSLSQGCLRCLTGFPQSDLPCYSDASGRGGCYARTNQFVAQRRNQLKGHDIIANGIHNDCLKIRLPFDDDWCLESRVPEWIGDQPMRWRVDCESADGSMSIALGILQRWAAANASMHFMTICSDHFAPSDEMLDWTASLPNTFVCHTVSGWFDPTELDSRFASIQRYIEHGIQTVIWICTSPGWNNDPVMQRALELVPPTHIVEVPHSRGKTVHELPLYGVNPLGHCQDQRRDMDGRLVEIVSDGGVVRHVVRLADGRLDEPKGGVRGKCLGCKVRCGEAAVFGDARMVPEHETATAPRVVAATVSDVPADAAIATTSDDDVSLRSIGSAAPRYGIDRSGRGGTDNVEWVDTGTVATETTPTVVDLFCGCGGMSHGFSMAGFRPVLGIDADPLALETYQWNTPDARTLLARIEDLTDDDILAAVGGESIDVLVGGPPCQGFSSAGQRRPDDPRNGLWQHFVHVAGVLKPLYLVLANVPGILSFEDGRVIDELLASLTDVGYTGASVLTLNAAEYGVPQLRERVLIVANRHGLPNPYPLPLLGPSEFVTVESAIADLQDLPRDEVLNHFWPAHEAETVERLALVRAGDSLHDTYTESWRRLFLDRPAPTVKGNSGGSAVHPVLPRTLSVREMARLQGFPDHFGFRGSMQSMLRQVGNAVPPPLAQHVALALRAPLSTLSGPQSAGSLQRVTCQVVSETLGQLLGHLLAWRKRTGHPLGLSDLIATVAAKGLADGSPVPSHPESATAPLTCHLSRETLDIIPQRPEGRGAVGGACPHAANMVSSAAQAFASMGHYDRNGLLWESHRRRATRS